MSEVIEFTRSATKQQQCVVLRPSRTQPLPLLLLLLRVHTATAHSCPYCKLTQPCCCDHTQPLLRAHSPCCCKVTQPLLLAHTAPAVASAHRLLCYWPPNLLLFLYLLLCNYTKITIYTYIQSFQILCKTLAGTQFVCTGPGSSVTSNFCRRGCSPSSRSGGAVVRFLREEQTCVHPPQHVTHDWVTRATTSGFIKNLEDWRILEPFHILTIYTLTVDVDVKICTLRSA